MNRLILAFTVMLILIIPQAWGATSQYPDPNRQTMWNNVTDSIHTLGQTPRQAQQTKRRLHYQRSVNRIKSLNQTKRRRTR